MATSSYGITQGLAADISRPLQYAMDRDLKSQVAQQKAQEQQRKDLDKLTSKLMVSSAKIGIPQNQQLAKEIVGNYLSRVGEGYKKDRNYINSVDMNVDFNKTYADLLMLGQSDASITKDLLFTMEHNKKFQLDEKLVEALKSKDMDAYKRYFTDKGLTPGQYTPGTAVVDKFDPEDFTKTVIEKLPTKETPKYLGTKGNAYAYEITKNYDNDIKREKVIAYFQANPAAAHYFGGDVDKGMAYIPSIGDSRIQLSNIAPKSGGSTFNFGGYGGNKDWGITKNNKDEIEIVSTGNKQNAMGRVIYDGVPYKFTYAKIDPDGKTVSIMLPPEKMVLKASKDAFQLQDEVGRVVGEIPIDPSSSAKKIMESYTGSKYDPQVEINGVMLPAREKKIPLADIKNQLEVNTGLKIKQDKTTTQAATKQTTTQKPATSSSSTTTTSAASTNPFVVAAKKAKRIK